VNASSRQDVNSSSFLEFVRSYTRALRANDRSPRTESEWLDRRRQVRGQLARSFGDFPAQPCPLDAKLIGRIERDGYQIERLIFQSRPGIWVTANAYVPAIEGRRPAVLSVHGHWPWARVDPIPHARAVGLVKLGYFVLAVDAFGAGERAIKPARGTYHGALLGASTWPVGTPLIGLQVYDNTRAVDYMVSRPEVDADKLAITGASGGGNQSMYAGAWDERLKAVVPVCSVGTYDSYIGAACCVCEALPGGLKIAEEGEILALVAPRSLMVINATRDAHQFSVEEAQKSIARARPMFELLNANDRLKHVVFESGHDYSQPMREAMYGWLARSLKGEGDGSPIPEPELTIEDVDTLRCFPDDRPQSFTLPPAFVYEKAKQKLKRIGRPDHREQWEANALVMKMDLESRIFGGFPRSTDWRVDEVKKSESQDNHEESFVLYPEPGMPVPCSLVRRKGREGALPTAILVDPAGIEAALSTRLVHQLLDGGWQLLAVNLRGTGLTAAAKDAVGAAKDHNSAEWAVWMGRPLLGQWCWDVLRCIDALCARDDVEARNLALIGTEAGGLAAICGGALDERARSVVTFAMLGSFASPSPPQGHRMATYVPFILDVADVAHLAALLAPRRLVVARPVDAQNETLNAETAAQMFDFTEHTYRWYEAKKQLVVRTTITEEEIIGLLNGA
jgi:cephalosporin-C deacetylase-like acetyl esterase